MVPNDVHAYALSFCSTLTPMHSYPHNPTFELTQLVHNWGLWRDTRNWSQLRTCYAPLAQVKTTWMVGSADAFIDASIQSSLNPHAATSWHSMGACAVQFSGDKALAETRVTLMLRARIHDVDVDVTAWCRFLDWCVHLEQRWQIAQRHPIHERDRMDPVMPGTPLPLDTQLLNSLPTAYRHLTYVQSLKGAHITLDLVQHNSPEQSALYEQAQQWLGS